MVMAASGSKSAAGATMKSAAQSNAPKSSVNSGVGGGNYASAGGGQGSGASYGGGSKTNTGSKISGGTNSNPSGSRNGGGNSGGSTTSRIGSAASAQRMSSAQASSATSSAPNAAAAKASAAYRASSALNAGLGRDPSPISGALNTSRSIATPPSLPNTRQPAQVQNYLGSGTATPFGGYQYGPGQMYADPFRSRAALGSVLNNAKLAGMDPRQTSDAVLRSAGMTNPMARAGVLGTFDHESAGFNPTIYGDQGTAYGLAQWRGPRQAGLQRYSAGMGQPTGTVGVQTAYALTEMGRAFPKTLNSLQAAQDVQSAVSAMNAYEKPRGYVPGGDPTVVAGWADRLARSNAALADVTKDQSRITPEQGTTTAFTKDQSRVLPSVPVLTANGARVPPTNVVPSWQQSTYTGPQERVLAVEDVPPLGTSAQGGLGVFGVSSPVASQRPLSVPSTSTTAQRNAFYGGGPTPPRAPSTYSGYGTFNGPTIVTTPDPNASLPNYAGYRQFVDPATPPNVPPSQREPLIDTTKTPYKAFKTGVDILGNGVFPGVGTAMNKAVAWDLERINQMTPAEQAAIKARWAQEQRTYQSGNTNEAGRNDRPAMSMPASAPSAPQTVSQPSDTASANWQSDALAYGYSEAQLNDPEIRALIKELWDMGFIPKTSSA